MADAIIEGHQGEQIDIVTDKYEEPAAEIVEDAVEEEVFIETEAENFAVLEDVEA
jgi:hypothetical protein